MNLAQLLKAPEWVADLSLDEVREALRVVTELVRQAAALERALLARIVSEGGERDD